MRLARSKASQTKQRKYPGQSGRLGGSAGMAGRVCWLGWQGRLEWQAQSVGIAGLLWKHGWPGLLAWPQPWSAWWGWGQAGLGQDRPGGVVEAGLVGQERAGQVCSSCERTYEWFLEMCVPSELAHLTKLTPF